MLEKLSKRKIQELIGKALYEEVSDFLENLCNDTEILEMNKKSGQIKLLLSLGHNTNLTRTNLWKEIYNLNNDEEKLELKSLGVDPNSSPQRFVESCLSYTYQKYGLHYEPESKTENIRPAVDICQSPSAPFKILKNFQTEIYWKILKHLDIPRSRFIVQMPTGSGKTRTAMEVISHQLKTMPNKHVIWLAHSTELIEQAASGFEEVWSHIGTHDVEVRVVDGDHNGLEGIHASNSSIVISTLQSMCSYLNESPISFEALSKSCSLLVVDEAHMSLAPTYKKLIKSIVRQGSLLMGLTATPGRNVDGDEDNKALAELYFQTPIRLECPEGGEVFSYLRKQGIMARTSMTVIKGSNESLSQREIDSFQSKLSIPQAVLNRLAAEDQRNLEIIYKILELLEESPKCKILFFACSVNHSRFITSVLKYKGIKAAHIDGGTGSSARKIILNDFKDGETNILSNYGVLATGFDAPKTDVVFIARPTASIVLYSQIIGRGLRGPAIGGTEKCMIVNVKDNIDGLPDYNKIYDYFDNYYVC